MYPMDLLKQYLKQVEETQLLELLDISSEELVEMFEQKIKERRAYLEKEVELIQEIEVSQAEDYTDDEGLQQDD
jgi:hypothetical protein